jgi:hypothetical protein
VAILPVRSPDVRITPPGEERGTNDLTLKLSAVTDREEIAAKANAILDSLVPGRRSRLLGPSDLVTRLDRSALAASRVYLDDPGPLSEEWKVKGLRAVAASLDVAYLIRLRYHVEAELSGSSSSGQAGHDWKGRVMVRADVFSLQDPRHVARSSESGSFRKRTTVLLGASPGGPVAIPIVSGKGLGRAMREATLQVIENLLRTEFGQESPR